MVNIVARSYIGIFAILVSGCSTLPVPAWVEGKSQHYTTTTYLLGHGIGKNPSIAKDNAAQKITQQFKSVAESDEFNSQANIIFNQIEYEEPWLNTNTSQHHMLAFISRDKAASFIQSKMLALDELTYQFFEQAKRTTDLLEQTSYIDSAINAQTRRIKLKPVLKIITSENDLPSSYNVTRLSKIREQLQARINLQVDIENDKLGELDTIIKSSLDSIGFVRNEKKSSKNHLLVELKVDETVIPQTSGELLMQGVLTTSLQHKGDDAIRGSHQWTFSLTAKDHDSLIKKAREILTTQLNANLKRVIMDMMVIEYDTDENIPTQDHVDFDMPEFNTPDNNLDNNKKAKTTATKSIISDTKTDTKEMNNIVPGVSSEKINSEAVVAKPAELKKAQPEPTQTNEKIPDKSAAVEPKTSVDKPDLPSLTDVEDPISTLPALAN